MVKVSSLLKAAILVCTLVMLRYPLMLPGNAPIETKGMQAAIVALVGIVLAFFTLLVIRRKHSRHFKWLFRYLIPYLLVIAFSMLYTVYLYNYSISDMIISVIPYLYILFAIPLIYIFCCDGSSRHAGHQGCRMVLL